MSAYGFSQPSTLDLNEANIKAHIEELTSEEYGGRLIGSKGNEETLKYMEDHFKNIGLKSFNEDTYRYDFNAITFNWNGIPKFNIIDHHGQIIESYEEGKDFIFRFDNMSLGGQFRGGLVNITDSKEIIEAENKLKNKAVLIDYEDPSIKKLRLSEEEVDDRLHYIGKTDLIIYEETNPMENRNINLGYKNKLLPRRGIIKIGVHKDTYNKLKAHMNKGYEVDIHIPISFTEVNSSNIYGFIPGKNYPLGNYMLIGASIDGMGINWNGDYYPGASDSAASTALILELARIFSSKEEVLDTTIIFAGFNGKHTGSVGIQEYLRRSLVMPEKTEVIYLDKVSGQEEDIIKIATYLDPNAKNLIAKKILNQFAHIGKKISLDFEIDHEYPYGEYFLFRNNSIIASNLTYGHNKNVNPIQDHYNRINVSKVKEVGILVKEYIEFYGRRNLSIELKDLFRDTCWIFFIGVILTLLKFGGKESEKEGRIQEWLKSKPIISIYLTISFFFTILIMQTKHNKALKTGLLLQDIRINVDSLLNMLALNIFTTLPMLLYLLITITSIVLGITALYFLGRKLNSKIYLLLMAFITYITFMNGFKNFYDDRYTIIYPKLLSFHKAEYIVVLLILIYSLLLTWVLSKEIKKTNNLKLLVIFLGIFFILVAFTYSPYVLSKEIINLKATGGRFKL